METFPPHGIDLLSWPLLVIAIVVSLLVLDKSTDRPVRMQHNCRRKRTRRRLAPSAFPPPEDASKF